MTSMLRVTLAGAVGVLVFGCAGDEPEGLRATPLGTGPQVVWDVDRRPLPEIPFPNDYALSLAADAPTGKRINISAVAPTEVESEFRRRAGRLDGFGLFAPISVRFDAPLNLKDLSARQRANTTFEDDAVLLLDITPGSPDYGKAHRLDFGSGWLPGTVMDPDFYGRQGFDSSDHPQVDPHDGASSLIFETQREDGKDVDGDGVKDVPNIFPADGNPWDDLLTWYERQTDPVAECVLRVPNMDEISIQANFPARVHQTEQRSKKLILTLPCESAEAQDLAAPGVKAHTFETVSRSQIIN